MFLIDVSSNLDSITRDAQIEFFKDLVDLMHIGQNGINVAAVKLDDSTTSVFNLTDYMNAADVKNSLDIMNRTGGLRSSWSYESGLRWAYMDYLRYEKRASSIGYVIGVSGDMYAYSANTESFIRKATNNSDKVITISVGYNNVGSASDTDHYFEVPVGDNMTDLAAYVINLLCPCKSNYNGRLHLDLYYLHIIY